MYTLHSRLNKMKGELINWQTDLKKFPNMQCREMRWYTRDVKGTKEVMRSLFPKSSEGEKENGESLNE